MPPMRRLSSAAALLIVIASVASQAASTSPAGKGSSPVLTADAARSADARRNATSAAASAAPPAVIKPPVELDAAVRLAAAAPRANPRVLALAVQAAECARRQGHNSIAKLAVIDYSLPSTRPRLWVFDLDRAALLFEELVAHGKGTGERFARHFSNVDGSKMSSLGLFRTGGTYVGANGYSMRLEGLERGFNDRAERRAIVMHGAPYVSRGLAEQLGRIGRSWGCPAVRQEVAKSVIDTLKGGSLVFAYYPDERWLHESRYLSCPSVTPLTASQSTQSTTSQLPGPARRTGS
jgi:hypothetical protein